MRVVNDDGEITIVWHALEPTRRAGAFLQRTGDDVEVVVECQATRGGGERVVDVGWANQRRMKIAISRWRAQIEAHAVERKFRIPGRYICFRFDGVTDDTQTFFS